MQRDPAHCAVRALFVALDHAGDLDVALKGRHINVYMYLVVVISGYPNFRLVSVLQHKRRLWRQAVHESTLLQCPNQNMSVFMSGRFGPNAVRMNDFGRSRRDLDSRLNCTAIVSWPDPFVV